VGGSSPSETEVLQYAQNLDDSGRFAEIIIASMKKVAVESVEGEGTEDESIQAQSMDFTLILKVGG
jgi:hypothetical protein